MFLLEGSHDNALALQQEACFLQRHNNTKHIVTHRTNKGNIPESFAAASATEEASPDTNKFINLIPHRLIRWVSPREGHVSPLKHGKFDASEPSLSWTPSCHASGARSRQRMNTQKESLSTTPQTTKPKNNPQMRNSQF